MSYVIRKQSPTLYVLYVLKIARLRIDAFDTTRDSMVEGVFAHSFQCNRTGSSFLSSSSSSLFLTIRTLVRIYNTKWKKLLCRDEDNNFFSLLS